jgi:hypothetical protein
VSSRGAGSNLSGARVRITRAHRRSPVRSIGDENDARVTAAPAALSSPLEMGSAERRSTINLATASSVTGAPPSSAAGGSAGGNSHPTTQQARSAFRQFFSSLRDIRDSAGRSAGSPPEEIYDARAAMGVAVGASVVRGASSPSNRMTTIRFVTRPTAPTRETLPGVDRDGRSRLTNRPPSRSSGGRSASGGSGDEDSGRGGSDEPIVID